MEKHQAYAPPSASTAGQPLAHYRQHGADVGLYCNGCAESRVIPLEALITRLNARGFDGAQVGVIEAARYVIQACRACGGRSWTTRPRFPSIPGQSGFRS